MKFVMMVRVYLKLIFLKFIIPKGAAFHTFFIIIENLIKNGQVDGQVDILNYDDMIEDFFIKAKEFKCSDGTPKECMAYLVGYKEEGTSVATELIFPEQIGDSGKVEDLSGKIIFEMFPNCKCL